ncbi:MAG: carboxypeptidase-like regulatory domain-containing protein [Terracidiphilus sp.]
MKTKNPRFKMALCALFLFLAVGLVHAATVRGRLIHPNGYTAGGIAVTVINSYGVRCSPAYTGADGMYYLFNIPAGPYRLEIWVYPGGAPMVYQIQVYEPYTDMPQIVIPY